MNAAVSKFAIGRLSSAMIAPAIGVCVVGAAMVLAGCQSTSPPPRIAVPDRVEGNPNATFEHDRMKPLPAQPPGSNLPPPPYVDEPLINERPPEEPAYVNAYNRVGHPRIAVIVNPQLQSGEDELSARAIDYTALETILADWLGADGHVTLISPSAARQRLTDQQVKDLQSTNPTVSRKVADQLAADVIVQLQAQPTRQAGQPAARLVAEAVNVKGGQSIARAVLDVPPPLESKHLEECTRIVARKLMDEMTATWNSFPSGGPVPPAPPPATVPPAPPSATVPPAPPPATAPPAPPPVTVPAPTPPPSVPPPPSAPVVPAPPTPAPSTSATPLPQSK